MAVNVLGRHELMLGNTFVARDYLKSPNKETPPQVNMILMIFLLNLKYERNLFFVTFTNLCSATFVQPNLVAQL